MRLRRPAAPAAQWLTLPGAGDHSSRALPAAVCRHSRGSHLGQGVPAGAPGFAAAMGAGDVKLAVDAGGADRHFRVGWFLAALAAPLLTAVCGVMVTTVGCPLRTGRRCAWPAWGGGVGAAGLRLARYQCGPEVVDNESW